MPVRDGELSNKERIVSTTPASLPLWQPPAETVESIALVLMSHWRAAKKHPERLFWPDARDWLHSQAVRLAGGNRGPRRDR